MEKLKNLLIHLNYIIIIQVMMSNNSNTNIQVRIDDKWMPAKNYQQYAFLQFKKNGEKPYIYKNINNDITLTISRENGGIYLIRENLSRSPIADWFSVKTIIPQKQSTWIPADDLITKLYFDFIYCHYGNKIYTIGSDLRIIMQRRDDGCVLYKNKYNEDVLITDNENLMTSYINCNKNVGIYNKSSDWFFNAFNFTETNYDKTQEIFRNMFLNENKKYINGIKIGKFELFDNATLRIMIDSLKKHLNSNTEGFIRVGNIVDDIVRIHQNECLSKQATIQVASQLNCLEMINYDVVPEDGIKNYHNDKTQGPLCAMSCPAALAYRNYLVFDDRYGQTSNKQLNIAQNFMDYISSFDKSIKYNLRNGYLLFDSDDDLLKVNIVLARSSEIRDHATSLIQIGCHSDIGVFINSKLYDHTVNHIYCSGLPISYSAISNVNLWDGLAEIFLDAMYENTLFISCILNIVENINAPCYLTKLGGGVFGMKHSQILNAIQKACQTLSKKGMSLDVKIVHHGNLAIKYKKIETLYPSENIDIKSVWDDKNWIERYATKF